MARKPSPWYRSERNQWWVRIRGEDHCLGEHPPGSPKPKKSDKGRWNAPKEIDDAFQHYNGFDGSGLSRSEFETDGELGFRAQPQDARREEATKLMSAACHDAVAR